MSLITVVATDNYVSFMSDGRLTNKDGQPLNEHYKKILKVSDEIIIGAAGNHKQACILFENAAYWFQEAEGDIQKFVNNMQNWILTSIPRIRYPNINLQVAVGGINESQQISIFCFNNHETKNMKSKFLILRNEISYLVLGSTSATKNLRNLINSNTDRTIDRIIRVQEKTNLEISQIDLTVNSITFNDYIHLKG